MKLRNDYNCQLGRQYNKIYSDETKTKRNYVSSNLNNKIMLTKQQEDVLKRLKVFAETDLEAANRALSKDASEYDVRIALFLAKTNGIE